MIDSNSCGVSPTMCVCKKGRYLTSGVAASKCEISLPDSGGIRATETCLSESDPVRI
jgi:hypothetical protein